MKRASILVAHPWMGRGGSEATAMWTLHALQHDFEVTFVTANRVDFSQLNLAYGCSVDEGRIKVIKAPSLPFIRSGNQLVALQHAIFHRFCNRMGWRYDLGISCYNFVPFGKPSLQLVGDFSFCEETRQKFYVQGFQRMAHRDGFLRSVYIRFKKSIWDNDSLVGPGDVVLANSQWTSANLKKWCNLTTGILFPPVNISVPKREKSNVDPYGFFYIGRISPEKEIEKIVAILELVRKKGFPVTLELAGNSGMSDYEKLISAIVMERPWIRDLGYLCGEAKESAFARNSFGIQACQCEAFGIATAEMAFSGCLPLVPAGCGSAEVVPFPELQYESIENAAEKIIKLLGNPKLTEQLRRRVTLGTERFSSKSFVLNLRSRVDTMLPPKKVVACPSGRNVVKLKGVSRSI